ncbi:MAG: ABC transporter substrate-binding protein [Duncaniella sp.]|nr:ABC transporter substrate-binding protein [Duncaniella sp.]
MENGDTLRMEYARNISIVRHPSFTVASLRNPWDTTATLARYILVPRDEPLPDSLPAGTIVRVPLQRSVIYSTVHFSLANELGAGQQVAGVCDVPYIRQPELAAKAADGSVVDCGSSQSPVIEKIISLSPDAILLSPFENSGNHGKIAELGVPVIECADYMEASPLARAEWIKFFGLLWDTPSAADSLWRHTRDSYLALTDVASRVSPRPKVISDTPYNGVWWTSAAGTTWHAFLNDAGADIPLTADRSGVVPLSAEQMLAAASDADVWLIRYFQPMTLSLSDLRGENDMFSRFKAFRNGQVYGCNTETVPFYEEIPFHPQWLLADLIRVLHPSLADSVPAGHSYYTLLR